MVLWLKPMVLRRNRGPPVNVHTWLCCSARAGIMVSSCNPLWDYINVLSWHNLFTLCEILYWWCSVMVSRLMIFGAAAKLRSPCECTRKVMLLGAFWYRGLWSWSIVELHWCVIFRGLLPWNDFCVVCWNNQTTYAITFRSKEYITLMYSLGEVLTSSEVFIENRNLSVSSCVVKSPHSCMVSFLLALVVIVHLQVPFASFVVKVKSWSFLVLRDTWLVLKSRFLSYVAKMQEFVHSLLCWPMHFQPCWFVIKEINEQHGGMDLYSSIWPPASKCEPSTLDLPMGNKRTCSMSKVVQQVGFTNL
jgi:hypothetical protein